MDLVIGISGASGVIYGIRLLEVVQGCTTHLILTKSARKIMKIETDYLPEEVECMANFVYDQDDFTAPVASGSFRFDAMVIAPCSMRTLAGVASGASDNLLLRSADVCLKERRKLVLVPRETPLSLIHMRNMVHATEAGAVIMPASPAFYSRPESLQELVDSLVGRILDQVGLDNNLVRRWGEGNAYNGGDQT